MNSINAQTSVYIFIFSKTNDFDRKYHEKILLKKSNNEISIESLQLYIYPRKQVFLYVFFFYIYLSQSFLIFLIRILYNISDILVNDEKDKLFHQLLSTKK